MNKRIFYGEYTLLHWIELILQKNIVLPDYQRSFVWSKEQVESFLKNLKKGIFVPPIIIGSLEQNSGNENIILDGQQRLSSILLGYLGIFPKPDAFKSTDDPLFIMDNSDDEDGEDESVVIEWSFRLLTNAANNRTKASILSNIDNAKYDIISAEALLDDAFINETFLGFSYIVPMTLDESEQQKFYSTVFHDINQQGVALLGQESRKSLYYLNKDLVPFFDPKTVTSLLKVLQGGKVRRYDYVRLLAFLAEYKKKGSEVSVAKKCKGQEKFELYYESYINSVVTDTDSPRFGKFSSEVGIRNVPHRMEKLKRYINLLEYGSTFPTVIDADTKLFGLVYQVLFLGKSMDENKKDDLLNDLRQLIDNFKNDDKHREHPNGLSHIRRRLKESISIYSRYVL